VDGPARIPDLRRHHRHHREETAHAFPLRSARQFILDERLVGHAQKPAHVGLVLEHEHQLRKILEAVQILRRQVIQEPPLKRVEVHLIEQIVGDKLLRGGIVARLGIIFRRDQRTCQYVNGRFVLFRLVAFHEDDVILLGMEFAGVFAVEPPVFAVAADKIVAAGLEFQVAHGVQAGDDRQRDAPDQEQPGPAANGIRQRI